MKELEIPREARQRARDVFLAFRQEAFSHVPIRAWVNDLLSRVAPLIVAAELRRLAQKGRELLAVDLVDRANELDPEGATA